VNIYTLRSGLLSGGGKHSQVSMYRQRDCILPDIHSVWVSWSVRESISEIMSERVYQRTHVRESMSDRVCQRDCFTEIVSERLCQRDGVREIVSERLCQCEHVRVNVSERTCLRKCVREHVNGHQSHLVRNSVSERVLEIVSQRFIASEKVAWQECQLQYWPNLSRY